MRQGRRFGGCAVSIGLVLLGGVACSDNGSGASPSPSGSGGYPGSTGPGTVGGSGAKLPPVSGGGASVKTGASGAIASTVVTPSGGASGTLTTGTKAEDVVEDCSVVAAGDVAVSAPSGTFSGSLSVELSTTLAGAEIRYTTDGLAPTASSSLYAAPIAIASTTRLRAAAFSNGAVVGKPAGALYIARAAEGTHDIPVIVLDSYGSGALPTDYTKERPFVDVGILSYEPPPGGTVSLSDQPTLATFGAFHVRGNSSSMFEKIPYRLEFRDLLGKDRDCAAVGMPAESDWALVGPHADKTLVHNNFVYDLGREMGLQVPRVKLVEVYVNVDNKPLDEADYQGVYQLVETVKNQKNRVNLKQLNPNKTSADQVTGGYIFKFDWMLTAEVSLECPASAAKCWRYLELIDPVPIAAEQRTYITNHLVSFNDALHSASIADPSTGYPAFIEVQSFIDQIIVNELTRNMDAFARSQFFNKDRDKKIVAGPLWDFDLIAGTGLNPGGMMGASMANTGVEGWQYEGNASRLAGGSGGAGGPGGGFGMASDGTADWFPVLIAEPTFRAQLVARWKTLRGTLLSDAAISARIDAVSAGLANAAERNFVKWNILTQAQVAPFDTPTEPTWAAQVAYMKNWLVQRAAWIDTQWI